MSEIEDEEFRNLLQKIDCAVSESREQKLDDLNEEKELVNNSLRCRNEQD